MTTGIKTIIAPVSDLEKAKAFYTTLFEEAPYADSPYYVGFRVGDQEFGLNPHGHSQGMSAPVCFFEVPDIKASLDALIDAGGTEVQPIRDVGGGKLIASATDTDGNTIGLMQNP